MSLLQAATGMSSRIWTSMLFIEQLIYLLEWISGSSNECTVSSWWCRSSCSVSVCNEKNLILQFFSWSTYIKWSKPVNVPVIKIICHSQSYYYCTAAAGVTTWICMPQVHSISHETPNSACNFSRLLKVSVWPTKDYDASITLLYQSFEGDFAAA